MPRTKSVFFIIAMLVFVASACGAQPMQAQPTPAVTQILEPAFTPSEDVPRSEAEVPRVSIEETRAALESGTAIIVDVRSSEAYEESHIAGAISVPLGEIERNLSGLTLDKDQWIITYCT